MYSGTGVVTPTRYEWAEWKNGNYVTTPSTASPNTYKITFTHILKMR